MRAWRHANGPGNPSWVPILHAGPGCAQKLAGGIAGNNGDSGYISPQIYPCTNVTEKETIFGGEEKLSSTIENALKVIDGDLYVVFSGCTAEIVGDDIAKVVLEFSENEKPVVYVETAGFKGTNLQGHDGSLTRLSGSTSPNDKPEKKRCGDWSISGVPFRRTIHFGLETFGNWNR